MHTTRQSIPGKPDPCDSTLDAMVMTADKTTYAFKGAYFWPVGDYGVFTEALKISEFWDGLEGDIDAAYTRQYDGVTFIFKGSKWVTVLLLYLTLSSGLSQIRLDYDKWITIDTLSKRWLCLAAITNCVVGRCEVRGAVSRKAL